MHLSSHPTLAQCEQYAGAPIQRFDDRNSYQGWQVIGSSHLLVIVNNDAYLLGVAPPCAQMQYATDIHLANATPSEVSRLDYVLFEHERCLIDEIRPLDYGKLRQQLAQREPAAARG
jgi:hypothetical protein